MHNFFLLIFFCFFWGNAFAQNDSLRVEEEIKYDQGPVSSMEFDDEQIAEFQKDEAFDYVQEEVQENWWTRFKNWVGKIWSQFWNWLFGSYDANGVLAFLIRILPYLFLAIVFGFAVWLFIKLDPAASVLKDPQKPGVTLSEEEKIIQREDISELIKKALKAKNYRLAVRYYYLLILKKMRENELIDYQFQKTNEEYLVEIKAATLNEQFKSITRIYDFIWYGDFPVTETDFKKVESEFQQIQTTLKNHKFV